MSDSILKLAHTLAAPLIIGAAMLVAAILIVAVLSKTHSKKVLLRRSVHYQQKKPLTTPECLLFFKLKTALPELEILAQVAFSQFIEACGGTQSENFAYFGRARQKVADFLICRKDFSIIAIVELDDRSHSVDRDKKRDAIAAEAGIHTIRWNVRKMPDEQEIRDHLAIVVTSKDLPRQRLEPFLRV